MISLTHDFVLIHPPKTGGKYDEEIITEIAGHHKDDIEYSKKLFCKGYEF